MPDRDRRQLLNALLALQEYKEIGETSVLLPLDMATSALILMSAMYRCVTTMSMVGLTTSAKSPEEQILEPVSDSYTRLYETALGKLPPAARKAASLSLTRDELKKKVIMPDYYGSSAAIKRMPEELYNDFQKNFKLDKNKIFDAVYNKPNANVFLGSFGPFAGKHAQHPYVREIILEGFLKFIHIHVACFPEAKDVQISFVGAVA